MLGGMIDQLQTTPQVQAGKVPVVVPDHMYVNNDPLGWKPPNHDPLVPTGGATVSGSAFLTRETTALLAVAVFAALLIATKPAYVMHQENGATPAKMSMKRIVVISEVGGLVVYAVPSLFR